MSMMGLDIQISEVGHVSPRYFFVRMLRNLVMVLRPPEGRLSSVRSGRGVDWVTVVLEHGNRKPRSQLIPACSLPGAAGDHPQGQR
eukprot:759086-Hanusia_phi.AAC.3